MDVLVDHHLLEQDEVFDRQNLLQQALVDAFVRALLRHHEVRLRDAQVLNIRLKLALDESLKLRVNLSVVKSVLFSVLKHDAVLLDEADNWIFP